MVTFIDTNIIAPSGNAFTTSTGGDQIHVLEGVVVAAEQGDGIAATNTTSGVDIVIDGTVAGSSRSLDLDGPGNNVVVGQTGRLVAFSSSSGTSGILATGGGTQIRNFGEITSVNGRAIGLSGGDNVITNYGAISAGAGTAVTMASFSGGPDALFNFGTISSDSTSDPTISIGEADATVFNAGRIVANGASGEAAVVFAYDLTGSDSAGLENQGVIVALGVAVNLAGLSGDARVMVVNTGTISGGAGAILGNDDADTGDQVSNTGTLIGDVALDLGDDILINAGTIVGNVTLGEGADVLREIGTGVVAGMVLGEAGNDTLAGGDLADNLDGGTDDDLLVGRAGNDTLTGGAGADHIIGGDGDDSLTGGTEDDTLNGGAGADEMFGEGGADLLLGRDGDDLLDGGSENDTIDGGAGDDQIEGGDGDDIMRGRAGEDQFKPGLGRDVMTGGQDADTFIFATTAIAGLGPNRDVIQDFEQGTDLINVVAMAPGAFDFIGTAPFSGTGIEIRVIETATGTSVVEFDADGNGTADAQLKITGVLGLTADDFAL